MIDKIVSDLIQIATEAKAHYQIWWAIEHDGRENFSQSLNRFQDVFEATRIAHFRSMVMDDSTVGRAERGSLQE